jgi:hypothetical protein
VLDVTADFRRRAYHDLATFGIPADVKRAEFQSKLAASFLVNPFVADLTQHLRVVGSMHFGGVNTWIHERCEDIPLPYKWEIKSTTHALYNWLMHFIPQVTWDRPNYSQVIYWERK